jgi:hypothetical protein
MKAVVRNGYWIFTTQHFYTDSNSRFPYRVDGLEFYLLMVVLNKMKMTFEYVPTPEGFQTDFVTTDNLRKAMFEKKAYIALGAVGTNFLAESFLGSTSPHTIMSAHWYVPCPDKYERWSSMFRILSVELWLVLIISIFVAAISTTILARYSCTSEWQVYKTVTSSLTNIWAVILGVGVSTMPRAPSLRSLFLAWVCFCIAFSTVFQAFLTTYLVDPGHKKKIENMDELLASGIFLLCQTKYIFFITNDNVLNEHLKLQHANSPLTPDVRECTIYHKNASYFAEDLDVEQWFYLDKKDRGTSETSLCKLEDEMVYNHGLSMIMFHGDPLLRRVSEIIDRVVAAGLCKQWISMTLNQAKVETRKIGLVHPLDGYYSFKMYHMLPVFYLLLMGWCLSSLCFIFELLYNRILSKRK